MTKREMDAAAVKIASTYSKHTAPEEIEVAHLAAEHGLDRDDVIEIIDSYRIVDGKPTLIGPGGGGDWLTLSPAT